MLNYFRIFTVSTLFWDTKSIKCLCKRNHQDKNNADNLKCCVFCVIFLCSLYYMRIKYFNLKKKIDTVSVASRRYGEVEWMTQHLGTHRFFCILFSLKALPTPFYSFSSSLCFYFFRQLAIINRLGLADLQIAVDNRKSAGEECSILVSL